jgi:putative transposase
MLYARKGYKKPYGKDALWSPSYFVSSVGGAPYALGGALPYEVLKKYIQNQEKPS